MQLDSHVSDKTNYFLHWICQNIYIIFWYIIPTVLLMVLLCIHCPVDTNKRWYFYPIYYGSSNTPRSIVYKSNLFRTENLRQCVFHRETFKGQQHHLKAYHVWDNFWNKILYFILQPSMFSILIIMLYV